MLGPERARAISLGVLLKLQWADVNFQQGFLRLRDPKGGLDTHVPINASAKAVLVSLEKKEGNPYVFPGEKNKQRVEINKAAIALRDKGGLPTSFRPFHGLRHAYASMLASSGKVDLYTLQKLLTHKSPAMTQRYAHLRDETLRAAAGVADDIVRFDWRHPGDLPWREPKPRSDALDDYTSYNTCKTYVSGVHECKSTVQLPLIGTCPVCRQVVKYPHQCRIGVIPGTELFQRIMELEAELKAEREAHARTREAIRRTEGE